MKKLHALGLILFGLCAKSALDIGFARINSGEHILHRLGLGTFGFNSISNLNSNKNEIENLKEDVSSEEIKTQTQINPKPNEKYYVVLGGSPNPVYLFPLLITVLQWRKIGADSIVCFSNSTEEYKKDNGTKYVIEQLQQENVKMIFLPTEMSPPHTIAQTCRLFVAGSPDLSLAESDILITSDSDLWVFEMKEHIPKPGHDIFSYNSRCCRPTRKPNSTRSFNEFPMSTIATSVKLWKQLMNITSGWLVNGDVLAQRLYDEFYPDFIRLGRPKPHLTASWNVDQVLVSEKIDDYMKNKTRDVLGECVRVRGRIDRIRWPSNFSNYDLSQHSDAHILNPLHPESNWGRTLGLLKKMFDEKEMERIQKYRDEFSEKFRS